MPSVDLPSLDLDLPQLDVTTAERNASGRDFGIDVPALDTLTARAKTTQEQDMDLSAIGLDLSPTTISGPATTTGAGSGQWQEMASKLDLASAYGEIGDKEGARELLSEVVKEGNPEQQAKAQGMLAKLS